MKPRTEFRITTQRRIILDELRMMGSHPTASDLYEAVRRRLPNISLGTVYRNLEILAQKGLIGKIVTNGRQMRFDADPEMHCHVRCIQCGMVSDIALDRDILSRFREGACKSGDFEILDTRVEVIGLCGDCAADKSAHEGQNP